ncbi:EAL domain-containing protein [Microbacterium sp. ARD32]|uniref:EAL domain-containing protein n=1 Tax=Microbacterium sp. ARD32 TaxID=2962577 RepID=UPI002881CD1A|nr:EAL domain-containing protein [Microbacterium sp. ARD32]MDT0156023.1 EAL domain-containing protein [Microbacterium sp. ARD32]
MTAQTASTALFQPIVDLRAARVIGFEALTRFADGLSPLEHLRAAETEGRREQLELQLIAAAVDAASALPPHLFVTLNASGQTMTDPFLAELLQRGERAWGLELFEGSAPEDCVAVRAQVDRLGGFLLIDDAGADHSDEDRIRQLQPDIVKIDRELFWRSGEGDGPGRIDSLLAAARAVGAQTLIEGVEDAAQLTAAHALDADLAQGYHLGRPTPPDGVAGMLTELEQRTGVVAAA